jgi:hypothetical protein
MSSPAFPLTHSDSQPAVHRLRNIAIAAIALTLSLIALYAIFLDQGLLLSPVLGKISQSANYIHEFAHDGRHLLGAPCH